MNYKDFWIEFFEKQPPYKAISTTEALWETLSRGNWIIEAYCDVCEKTRSFKLDANSTNCKWFFGYITTRSSSKKVNGGTFSVVDKPYFIQFAFVCTHCGEVHYMSTCCVNDGVMKYGQFPPFANESEHDFVKYKNVISKYYIELKRSVNAYSQNMGIAAFVYLRRIFEHLVEKEYASIKTPSGKESFDEKMKVVDKEIGIIPVELDAVKSLIYSVLSKGVHEYEEEECLEVYPYMQFIITQILDKYLAEKERKSKLAAVAELLKGKKG